MTRDTSFPTRVAELIWNRDGGCCARCGRGLTRERRGEFWAIHHRAPRGRGGAGKKAPWVNGAANGVCLCNVCHDEVEAARSLSRDQGWLVSRLSVTRPSVIAILHALHGVVYLDDDGGWTRA